VVDLSTPGLPVLLISVKNAVAGSEDASSVVAGSEDASSVVAECEDATVNVEDS
jgi:hypothetical protein